MMESKLFEPLPIGSMTIKNRTFMAPMSLGYESPDGIPNETMQEYWLARARGGVGCIILDALSVDPAVPYLGNTLCFRSGESIDAYRKFTSRVHEYGTKIIPQITHPGPESVSAFRGIPPMASSVYLNSMGQKTRALALEEIPGIIRQYAEASWNAMQAGFDGIELHCAHAYMLLGSFLSPIRNKRTDRYGGTLDNRARLLTEVLDAIRERCGNGFPILLRMCGSERDEQGNTLEDMKYLIPRLIRHGVDAFEISGGTQYERCQKIIPCHGEIRGVNVPEAEEIRKVSTAPVIAVGKINEPSYAMYLVDSGKVDGVVIGRALLSDAEFVSKTQERRWDEIAPCAACGIGCVGEQTKRRPASCVINPALGRERELQILPAPEPKTAVVAGGGIGGMACARILALRGHRVVLLERESRLGGQLNLACIPPHKQEISRWVSYLNQELERLAVDVRTGVEATTEVLDSLHPDITVIATGAKETVPPVPGVDPATAVTAWQVLREDVVVSGGNVLVVGGGMVGCELCEFLMHQKRGPLQVTMIEMDTIAAGMVPNNRVPMMEHLVRLGVRMMPGTKLVSIDGGNVTVSRGGQEAAMPERFTQIIFACGSRGVNSLYEAVKDRFPKVFCIGDANSPRQALEAVREGWEAALNG